MQLWQFNLWRSFSVAILIAVKSADSLFGVENLNLTSKTLSVKEIFTVYEVSEVKLQLILKMSGLQLYKNKSHKKIHSTVELYQIISSKFLTAK